MLVYVSTLVLVVAGLVPSPFERRSEWERVGPDKFLHLVGHGVYAMLVADVVASDVSSDRSAAVLGVGVSTLLSLVTGRLQNAVPGRAFELADVVAGLVGSVLCTYWWCAIRRDADVDNCPDRRKRPWP
ncbi:hypothetical protein EGH21_15085 [Halomicroarcula sp. F13]|uniref:VanZ family protein n=1 Tax=Haloarcula rubra TaxID=2487747 RepID=A0AAW4PRY3_9EURY|nr:hypothetical protein [Halomicroarcula rubra]MBX0324353.1 hypothetical protein [Halomicroarcula rubra]